MEGRRLQVPLHMRHKSGTRPWPPAFARHSLLFHASRWCRAYRRHPCYGTAQHAVLPPVHGLPLSALPRHRGAAGAGGGNNGDGCLTYVVHSEARECDVGEPSAAPRPVQCLDPAPEIQHLHSGTDASTPSKLGGRQYSTQQSTMGVVSLNSKATHDESASQYFWHCARLLVLVHGPWPQLRWPRGSAV